MPNHASTSLCHPTEVRALTLKEYALIQEFPEDWEFSGTPAQQYAQAGNAVPVKLGQVTGEVVSKALDDLRANNWAREEGEKEDYRIIYVQSHVRTRQWFKDGKTKVWKDGRKNSAAKYAAPVTLRSERSMAGAR
jgi:DNA (cytosine-5)-methyltransferase 1